MAQYTPDDLYNFYCKDAKYSIGMALGNAFQKAVDLVISATEISKKDKTEEELMHQIFHFRDIFFEENQNKLEQEYAKFLENNNPQKWYNEQLQLKDKVQEAVAEGIPSIQQEDHSTKPLF